MKKHRHILLCAIVLVLCVPAFADSVILKNGNKLKGRIVRQTDEEVEIQVSPSGTTTVSRRDIDGIEINQDYGALNKKPEKRAEPEPAPIDEEPAKEKNGKRKLNDFEYAIAGFFVGLAIGIVIFGFIIAAPVMAFCLWLSIKIFDGDNLHNSYMVAIGWVVLMILASVPVAIAFPGLLGLLVDVVIVIIILMAYYKLSLIRSVLILVLYVVFQVIALVVIFSVLATIFATAAQETSCLPYLVAMMSR